MFRLWHTRYDGIVFDDILRLATIHEKSRIRWKLWRAIHIGDRILKSVNMKDPIIKCNFLSQRFLEKEHSNLFSKYICAIIFLLLLIRDRILKMRSLRGKVRNFFRFNRFHLQLSVISNTLSFENYKKILFILIETLIIFDKDWIEFFPFIAFSIYILYILYSKSVKSHEFLLYF